MLGTHANVLEIREAGAADGEVPRADNDDVNVMHSACEECPCGDSGGGEFCKKRRHSRSRLTLRP